MNALAPLYLAAAAAIALPILFHLIRRTPRDRFAFSTLDFLRPTPPRITRRSRVEHWLLLALRGLVLALLAAAFARPLWRQADDRAVAATGTRVTILLDAGASLRRTGLTEAARAEARAALEALGPNDVPALVTFDAQARTVVSHEQAAAMTPDQARTLVRAKLEAWEPGYGRSRTGATLLEAAEDLARTATGDAESGPPGRIILISDFTAGDDLSGLDGRPWPADVQVELRQLRPAAPGNVGLQAAAAASTDEPPRVRLVNSADAVREQFTLTWAEAKPAPVAPNADGTPGVVKPAPTVTVYVPAGQTRVVRAPEGTDPSGPRRLVVSGDGQPFDNELPIVAQAPEVVPVAYLGNDREDDPLGLRYYLERALVDTLRRDVQVTAGTIVPPAGRGAPMMYVVGEALDEAAAGELRARARAGATVLCVMRSVDGAGFVQALLDEPRLEVSESTEREFSLVARVDFEHPLFAPLADPRYADFTKAHFWRHRRLRWPETAGLRTQVTLDAGDPLLVEQTVEAGRIYVLTSGWQAADSELARSSKFVPLVDGLVEQARRRGAGGLSSDVPLVVGATLELPAAAAGVTRRLTTPDGKTTDVPATGPGLVLERPGLHALVDGERTTTFRVLLPAEESRTEPLPGETLELRGVNLGSAVRAAESETRRRQLQLAELEQQQKLWQWFLAGALALVAGETFLAGFLSRAPARSG